MAAPVLLMLLTPAGAQQRLGPPALPDGLGLEHGALFHGNDCDPGNSAPLPPIDALDLACMHHDACYGGSAPDAEVSCTCQARLRIEATRVARDPRQPDDLRALAGVVADGTTVLPCRLGRPRRVEQF